MIKSFNMTELAKQISIRAGIDLQQASIAVETVAEYLKARTPSFFHEPLQVILNGGTLSDALRKKWEILQTDLKHAVCQMSKKTEELATDLKKKFS
jgi:ATP-dependent Zn protease